MKRRVFIISSTLTLGGCASTSDPITTALYGDDYSWFNQELRIFNPSELKFPTQVQISIPPLNFFNNGTLIEEYRSDYWEAIKVNDSLKKILRELNFVENKEATSLEISTYREYLSKGVSAARNLFAPLVLTRAEQKTHGKVKIRYEDAEVCCEGEMIICPLSGDDLKDKNGLEMLKKNSIFSPDNSVGFTQSMFIGYFAERLAPQLLMNCIQALKDQGVFTNKSAR